jgi:uncharacterized protein YndB with AHSA1/START domain
MSVQTASSLRITRLIEADRQAVWDAWTQPEQMRKWSCPAPGGVQDLACDFRVGGSYTLRMKVEDNEYTAFGTYKEIDEPKRLVYTWDWKEEDHKVGETLVTVEFEARGGATKVVLVHEGFPAPEAREGHEQGWGACLAHFEALFA